MPRSRVTLSVSGSFVTGVSCGTALADNVHMPGLAAVRDQAMRRRAIEERGSVNNSSVRKAYRRVQRSHFPEGLRKHWTVLGLCQLG